MAVKSKNIERTKSVDNVALLFDSSGSMIYYRSEAHACALKQIAGVDALRSDGRQVNLSVYTFNGTVSRVGPTLERYNPNGGTALLDAIGMAIGDVSNSGTAGSNLVILVTDGRENASRTYGREEIKSLIRETTGMGTWTFVWLGPVSSRRYATDLGIPTGNIQTWDATKKEEYDRIAGSTVAGTQSYATLRSAGVGSTSTFFTDLSKVTARDLDLVNNEYRQWIVDKEIPISLFIPGKTGHPFETGRTWYQLSKTEARVWPERSIVLRHRATKQLYSGSAVKVRQLLGLPTDKPVRLKPGNHGEWDLFIQSKSDNRKLVRGTTVLYKEAV